MTHMDFYTGLRCCLMSATVPMAIALAGTAGLLQGRKFPTHIYTLYRALTMNRLLVGEYDGG